MDDDPKPLSRTAPQTTAIVVSGSAARAIAAQKFRKLAEVPDAVLWFANITNQHTRRAYCLRDRASGTASGFQPRSRHRLARRSLGPDQAGRPETRAGDAAPKALGGLLAL